ncbi:cytochrome P450 [Aspergillus heterothallicus]
MFFSTTTLTLLVLSAILYTLILSPLITYLLDRKGLRKYPFYSLFCALTNAGCAHFNLGNVIDKAEYTRKRKMLAGAFAARNVQGKWEVNVIRSTVRRLWSNLFTSDAIGEIAMSDQLGLLERGKDTVTVETVEGKVYTVPFRACLHASKIAHTRLAYADKWYHFNSRYTTRVIHSYRCLWKLSEGWDDFVNHRAKKRMAWYLAGEKLDDIFQHMILDREGAPYNLKHPKCLGRLREEIDDALRDEEKDTVAPYDKVKSLPYLRACLDEKGTIILGQFVPGGTMVLMSAYVAHHDEESFVRPEEFIPERWLDEKEIQGYFVPFSAGSRGCIRRNISYMEQTVLVASLVRRHEFTLPLKGWEQERVEVTNLLPGLLPLKIWNR